MALSTRLMMRQGQSLVMTPQLLQAIKLLQLSSLELSAFVEEELERNPLLERAEERPDSLEATAESSSAAEDRDAGERDESPDDPTEFGERDWASDELETDRGALESNLGTEVENTFDSDRADTPLEHAASAEVSDFSTSAWNGAPSGSPDGEAPNLEAYVAAKLTLSEHLREQLAVAILDPVDRLIGQAFIDSLDENGYLNEPVEELANRLGVGIARAQGVLDVIQTFDPSGVGARNLADCLAIQLRELDRYDPAMQAMVANLP